MGWQIGSTTELEMNMLAISGLAGWLPETMEAKMGVTEMRIPKATIPRAKIPKTRMPRLRRTKEREREKVTIVVKMRMRYWSGTLPTGDKRQLHIRISDGSRLPEPSTPIWSSSA
jgi:hypothetical protein